MSIVKYHNQFNGLALKGFTSTEMDLLMSLLSTFRDKGTMRIKIPFSEIKKKSGWEKENAIDVFVKDLKKTNEKLLHLDFCFEDEEKVAQFVLFPTFFINKKDACLEAYVNEEFAFLLNQLDSNFTRFELEEFTQLKGIHAKSLYRLLKQYRSTGYYRVTTEEFRELLDVPESYDVATMNRDVLNKAMSEIEPLLEGLKVNKIKQGRNIVAYEFTFKKVKIQKERQNDNEEETSGFICPECGEPMIWKTLNGNQALVHEDGWKKNAKCKKIYNSVAEVKGYKETPTRGDIKFGTQEELNENVMKEENKMNAEPDEEVVEFYKRKAVEMGLDSWEEARDISYEKLRNLSFVPQQP